MLAIPVTKTVAFCAFVYMKNERNVANKSHSTNYCLLILSATAHSNSTASW